MGKYKFVAINEHGRIILRHILGERGTNGRTELTCLKPGRKAYSMW